MNNLQRAVAIIKELLEVWDNEDKRPGWVKRFGAAKEAAENFIKEMEDHVQEEQH